MFKIWDDKIFLCFDGVNFYPEQFYIIWKAQ